MFSNFQVEVTSDTEQDAGAGPVEKDEVVEFPTNCYHCSSPAKTRMKQVGILHKKSTNSSCECYLSQRRQFLLCVV